MRLRRLVGLALLVVAAQAHADSTGRLTGLVRDETGAALPGAAVQARPLEGGSGRQTSTGPDGRYSLALAPGRYEVGFRLPSFGTVTRAVAVPDGGDTRVDVTLRIALNADVLVTGPRTFRNLTDIDESANGLVGLTSTGSEGVVTAQQVAARPVYRSGEVFESVPGVVVSQHSGEGKANQYYVRGFNIDHGTDLASFVAGVPVNMPTHAHGQGYSDNNFLIPELVSGVQYQKGTYSAEEGDFSAAGSINVNYLNLLDRPLLKLEGGELGFRRALAAASTRVGAGQLLIAAEAYQNDGPWMIPDAYRRLNGVLRYSRGGQQAGLSVTAMAYSARWHSTDQVPERAVASGLIDRFGTIDPTDRGETHRYSLSGEWRRTTRLGLTQVKAYAVDYDLDLFANFTYFLDDPVNGDQFEQRDVRRVVGASLTQRFLSSWFGRDVESIAGLQGRYDAIPTLGLYRTRATERLSTVRQDDVGQGSGAGFFQTSIQWTSHVRMTAGLRADLYSFSVRSDDPVNSGRRDATIASPKLGLVFGPWRDTEIYANWGWGFHSNDARGAVQRRDPTTGEPVTPVDPVVRARGAELGARTLRFRRWQSSVAVWGLDIAYELVFAGDAGTTEPSRPSRRIGWEWSNVVAATRSLSVDADLAWSRARFRDADPVGDRIPGAVEGVASAGVSVADLGPFSGSLRLRYFGPRPLIEDNSVRSRASTTLNLRAGCRLAKSASVHVDVYNLTNAKVSDIDYYYRSRLPGESADGIDDVHTHPLEPLTLRASLSLTF